MKLTADFHTHTKYSDGKNTVAENAARAKELGLQAVAITEHGYSHIAFGIRRRETEKFIREIEAAQAETGIKVLVGIEGNICGTEGTCDLRNEDFEKFDVYLTGFHVFSRHDSFREMIYAWSSYLKYHNGGKPSARLVRDTTRAYCNAVIKNPIDVITHINFQCFADAVEVAKCCRDYGTYVEISGKKTHFTDEELAAVANTGVRFVLNSDAHSVDRIGDIAIAEEQIRRVGIPLEQIDNIDGRMPSFRLAEYKRRNLL